MKKGFSVVAVILLVVVAVFLFRHPNSPKTSPGQTTSSGPMGNTSAPQSNSLIAPSARSGAEATNEVSPNDLASHAASPNPPAANEAQTLPPSVVLDNARVAMHNYNSAFGENPVGTNPEITAALMGKNPKQINFITPESGLRVNEKGEMVDAWGTPFFFHQRSGQEMELRSAGPDKIMWNLDDLVAK